MEEKEKSERGKKGGKGGLSRAREKGLRRVDPVRCGSLRSQWKHQLPDMDESSSQFAVLVYGNNAEVLRSPIWPWPSAIRDTRPSAYYPLGWHPEGSFFSLRFFFIFGFAQPQRNTTLSKFCTSLIRHWINNFIEVIKIASMLRCTKKLTRCPLFFLLISLFYVRVNSAAEFKTASGYFSSFSWYFDFFFLFNFQPADLRQEVT